MTVRTFFNSTAHAVGLSTGTALSLGTGILAGVGAEVVTGGLAVSVNSVVGAIPAFGLIIPTVLISIKLLKNVESKAELACAHLLLGFSACILSKGIAALTFALLGGLTINPVTLPFIIAGGLGMCAVYLFARSKAEAKDLQANASDTDDDSIDQMSEEVETGSGNPNLCAIS